MKRRWAKAGSQRKPVFHSRRIHSRRIPPVDAAILLAKAGVSCSAFRARKWAEPFSKSRRPLSPFFASGGLSFNQANTHRKKTDAGVPRTLRLIFFSAQARVCNGQYLPWRRRPRTISGIAPSPGAPTVLAWPSALMGFLLPAGQHPPPGGPFSIPRVEPRQSWVTSGMSTMTCACPFIGVAQPCRRDYLGPLPFVP